MIEDFNKSKILDLITEESARIGQGYLSLEVTVFKGRATNVQIEPGDGTLLDFIISESLIDLIENEALRIGYGRLLITIEVLNGTPSHSIHIRPRRSINLNQEQERELRAR